MKAPDFAALFGALPTVLARAPGRVNLIGEHTDYSGGLVLPTAIPRHTEVQLRICEGSEVLAWSAQQSAQAPAACYRLGEEKPGRDWLDYVQGVTWALRAAAPKLRGFQLRIDSDVPVGAGLSSSAALEVAVLRGLRDAFDLALDDAQIAALAHRAETEFAGAPVGIMDPMASSLADAQSALFLDTRTRLWQKIPLPPEWAVLVIHSGITHRHASGEYRTRRAEVDAAAHAVGVGQLRELEACDLGVLERLPEPLGRRARHVVLENQRVLAAVAALRAREAERFGALLYESHASLRDLFEVSLAELDLLVGLAREEEAVFGARLTGGGFGGSVVIVARAEQGHAAGVRIAERYAQCSGRSPLLVAPCAGPSPASAGRRVVPALREPPA
jgi:galactokinase